MNQHFFGFFKKNFITLGIFYNITIFRASSSYSLGGPASFHPSILPTFVKKASVPRPRHADVPVIAL